jgi:hypothetical protein
MMMMIISYQNLLFSVDETGYKQITNVGEQHFKQSKVTCSQLYTRKPETNLKLSNQMHTILKVFQLVTTMIYDIFAIPPANCQQHS